MPFSLQTFLYGVKVPACCLIIAQLFLTKATWWKMSLLINWATVLARALFIIFSKGWQVPAKKNGAYSLAMVLPKLNNNCILHGQRLICFS
jgi:hypothetical protein